jgi:hypothetical protein
VFLPTSGRHGQLGFGFTSISQVHRRFRLLLSGAHKQVLSAAVSGNSLVKRLEHVVHVAARPDRGRDLCMAAMLMELLLLNYFKLIYPALRSALEDFTAARLGHQVCFRPALLSATKQVAVRRLLLVESDLGVRTTLSSHQERLRQEATILGALALVKAGCFIELRLQINDLVYQVLDLFLVSLLPFQVPLFCQLELQLATPQLLGHPLQFIKQACVVFFCGRRVGDHSCVLVVLL